LKKPEIRPPEKNRAKGGTGDRSEEKRLKNAFEMPPGRYQGQRTGGRENPERLKDGYSSPGVEDL